MKNWTILDLNKKPFLIIRDPSIAKKMLKDCPDLRAEKIEIEDDEFVVDGGKLVERKHL